jgi:hypothetical protein
VTGKVELYLGSMESKHTTRFTRKQRNKRKRCVYILTEALLLYWTLFLLYIFNTIFIIFIGHYFLPIVYFIFILTQRLLPVSVVSKGNSCMLLKYNNNRNKQNTTCGLKI